MSLKDYEDLVREQKILSDISDIALDKVDFFQYYDRGFTPHEAAKHIRMVLAGTKEVAIYF